MGFLLWGSNADKYACAVICRIFINTLKIPFYPHRPIRNCDENASVDKLLKDMENVLQDNITCGYSFKAGGKTFDTWSLSPYKDSCVYNDSSGSPALDTVQVWRVIE